MQMSLALMPLNVSDELRKYKKTDHNASTGKNTGPNPSFMVRHPLYRNLLEASRTGENQSRGNCIKLFHLNQQLLNLYRIRKRLVEKLQRERWILAFREFATYLNEDSISPELIQENLNSEHSLPESYSSLKN